MLSVTSLLNASFEVLLVKRCDGETALHTLLHKFVNFVYFNSIMPHGEGAKASAKHAERCSGDVSVRTGRGEEPMAGPSTIQRQGYCSCCQVLYSSMEQHVQSAPHRDVVRAARASVSSGSLLERFLQDVLQHHPHHYSDARPTHDDIPLATTPLVPNEVLSEVYCGSDDEGASVGTREEMPSSDEDSCQMVKIEASSSAVLATPTDLLPSSQKGNMVPETSPTEKCSPTLGFLHRTSQSSDKPHTSQVALPFVSARSQIHQSRPRCATKGLAVAKTGVTEHKKVHKKTKRVHEERGSLSSSSGQPTAKCITSKNLPATVSARLQRSTEGFSALPPWKGPHREQTFSHLSDEIHDVIEEVIKKYCYGYICRVDQHEEDGSFQLGAQSMSESKTSEEWDNAIQMSLGKTKGGTNNLAELLEIHINLDDQDYQAQLDTALNTLETSEEPREDNGEKVFPDLPHIPLSFVGKTLTQVMFEDDMKIDSIVREFQQGQFRCYFDSESLALFGKHRKKRNKNRGKMLNEDKVGTEGLNATDFSRLQEHNEEEHMEDHHHPPISFKKMRPHIYRQTSRCQVVKVSHGTQTVSLSSPVVRPKRAEEIFPYTANEQPQQCLSPERTPDMKTRLGAQKLPASYCKIMSPLQPKTVVYVLSSPDGGQGISKPTPVKKPGRKRKSCEQDLGMKYKYKKTPLKFYDPMTNRILKTPPKGLSSHSKSKPLSHVRQLFRSLSPDINKEQQGLCLGQSSEGSRKGRGRTNMPELCTSTTDSVLESGGPSEPSSSVKSSRRALFTRSSVSSSSCFLLRHLPPSSHQDDSSRSFSESPFKCGQVQVEHPKRTLPDKTPIRRSLRKSGLLTLAKRPTSPPYRTKGKSTKSRRKSKPQSKLQRAGLSHVSGECRKTSRNKCPERASLRSQTSSNVAIQPVISSLSKHAAEDALRMRIGIPNGTRCSAAALLGVWSSLPSPQHPYRPCSFPPLRLRWRTQDSLLPPRDAPLSGRSPNNGLRRAPPHSDTSALFYRLGISGFQCFIWLSSARYTEICIRERCAQPLCSITGAASAGTLSGSAQDEALRDQQASETPREAPTSASYIGTGEQNVTITYPSRLIYYLNEDSESAYHDLDTRAKNQAADGQDVHLAQASFQLDAFGRKFTLDLTLNNDLLSSDYIEIHYEKDKPVLSRGGEHCYYHGHVRGKDESRVALSTCNGLHGMFDDGEFVYLIDPLKQTHTAETEERPHSLRRTSSLRVTSVPDDWAADERGEDQQILEDMPWLKRRRKRAVKSFLKFFEEMKYLEIMIVADHNTFKRHKSKKHTRNAAKSVVNLVDAIFKEQLNTRVVLVGVEIWTDRDRIPLSVKPLEMLKDFSKYRQQNININADAVHLFTNVTFHYIRSSVAYIGGVCSKGRGVGVNEFGNTWMTAISLSQSLAQNLGIQWDPVTRRKECGCMDSWVGCIMEDTGVQHPRRFSKCSVLDYRNFLIRGGASCLFNKPNKLFEATECGNGYVEVGEECDCGARMECYKDCCKKCSLSNGAHCSDGPCCNSTCLFFPRGYSCRFAVNDCDILETCSGDSGQCPPNLHKQDGYSCQLNQGRCYSGECKTRETQCKYIWGPKAGGSEKHCYEKLNTEGTEKGNCVNLILCMTPCSLVSERCDVFCGYLLCSAIGRSPRLGTLKGDITPTTFNHQGRLVDCRSGHGSSSCDALSENTLGLGVMFSSCSGGHVLLDDDTDLGYVEDGTPCGPSMMCLERKCVAISSLNLTACPSGPGGRVCSAHGVCNNEATCTCDDTWAGTDCSMHDPPKEPPVIEDPGPKVSVATNRLIGAVAGTILALGVIFGGTGWGIE
ncbi:hypothetical protein DNTS_025574 [Danionella cerebrum]|uniref:Disintegrin and metalloproteinase domain-containing protein 23 n=1 Tax=Danionella cerebrum TaxID=2873325 RepID=A0A553PYP6_9TELE|nr:hypothetical protein DNTS_025574 [Danionella translucida]